MAPTFTAKTGDVSTATSDALIVPIGAGAALPAAIAGAFDGQLAAVLEARGFSGKAGEVAAFSTFGRLGARALVLTGTGQPSSESGRWSEALRRAYGAAIKRARDEGARTIAAAVPAGAGAEEIGAIVEGLTLALYTFTRYKTGAAATPTKAIEAVEVWTEGGDAADAVAHGAAVASGVALARDLVNTISDDKTPSQIAAWAQQVAEEAGLACRVLDRAALEAGGYNAILTVGKGSAAEPRLIEMIYEPQGGGATKTIALVGKTITFDSGGLDLKSADGMYSMKTDMGGGASVLGAMKAVAALKPGVKVIGLLTAAENMPSGTAMRPSDVVQALNGKPFEIGNTDAEGRMVLADAVTHAARAGADEIIDLATLTGAKMVALGSLTVGAMGNDQELMDRFLASAAAAGERVWQLPTWDEYKDDLKSDIADIKSTGSRGGGAITAALFIGEFVEGKPWVHLDIAGSAATATDGPYTPKGATGVMVRSLLRYLEDAEK